MDRLLSAHDRRLRLAMGVLALAGLAAFMGGAFVLLPILSGIAPSSPTAILGDPYIRSVLVFTLGQAALSTLLSLLAGVALALALHRMRFRGRDVLLRLMLLPQALPTLVGALGLLSVFGRNGWFADLMALGGLSRPSIYGLTGVLLAHVFFNMPLVARLVHGSLSGIPSESWKLAGQLALPAPTHFRIVEWPAVRRALPGAASLVFTLCVTSFTLVLVLGGGPRATTVEVAIYQALRYDFDPGRAVTLSLLQVALVALLLLPTLRFAGTADIGLGLGASPRRYDKRSGSRAALDGVIVVLGCVFMGAPLAAILVDGLRADLQGLLGDPEFIRATLTSLLLATCATLLGLLLALALAFGSAASRGRGRALFLLLVSLVLVVPPIVLGAGWFLALRGFGDVTHFAPLIVVLANAAMLTPFALRILGPEVAGAQERHGRLAASLGLQGLARLRHVEMPALRRPLALATAFGLAISLGDLGAVALFGSPDFVTLPYLLLQRMGSYRSTDAEGLALLLALLCLGLLLLAERSFAKGART